MNLEIANRLQKLRKENGYSQEQLALELGISRQAVSKWERAESSPDTDNLILLARLYNVSLDELLSTDDSTEEIIDNKQVETVEPEIVDEDVDHDIDDETPKVSKRTERVLRAFQTMIPILTVAAYLVLGAVFKMWHPGWIVFVIMPALMSVFECIIVKKLGAFVYPLFATTVFLILGFYFDWWHPGWIIFITIPLFYMFAGMIDKEEDDK